MQILFVTFLSLFVLHLLVDVIGPLLELIDNDGVF